MSEQLRHGPEHTVEQLTRIQDKLGEKAIGLEKSGAIDAFNENNPDKQISVGQTGGVDLEERNLPGQFSDVRRLTESHMPDDLYLAHRVGSGDYSPTASKDVVRVSHNGRPDAPRLWATAEDPAPVVDDPEDPYIDRELGVKEARAQAAKDVNKLRNTLNDATPEEPSEDLKQAA